jgi:hypothetical protein
LTQKPGRRQGSYIANSISANPWRIDTLPFSYPYRVKIDTANWTDQTSLGDAIVFTDINGNTIIDSKAQAPNYQQNFNTIRWVEGLVGVTLDSGVLTVAIGAGK